MQSTPWNPNGPPGQGQAYGTPQQSYAQQPYAQQPYAQRPHLQQPARQQYGYGLPPHPQHPHARAPATADDKPIDPVRLGVGVGGAVAFALYAFLVLLADPRDRWSFRGAASLLGVLEAVAFVGIGVGLSGVRTMPGTLAAIAGIGAGASALSLRGLVLLEVRGYLPLLTILAWHGWAVVACVGFMAALASSHRRLGPAVFGAVAMLGITALFQASLMANAMIGFIGERVTGAAFPGAPTLVVRILSAVALAVALLVALAQRRSPRPA